jgi:outer membrane protein
LAAKSVLPIGLSPVLHFDHFMASRLRYSVLLAAVAAASSFPNQARAVAAVPAPSLALEGPRAEMPTTLVDLVVAALNHNLELRAKRLDPQIDQLRIIEAKGAFDPQFNFNQLTTHDQHPQNAVQFLSTGQLSLDYHEDIIHYETGFSGLLPTGGQWSLATISERSDNTFNEETSSRFHPEYTSTSRLTLIQPLLKNFGFSATLAEVRLAKAGFSKSSQDYRAAVIKTLAEVSGAYFEMVFGQENLKVKNQAVELAQRLVSENQRRLDQGKMSPIDVSQANERLSEAKEEVILAENFLAQRRSALRQLTSDSFVYAGDTEDTWAVDGTSLLREFPELPREKLLNDMIENNPGYLASMALIREEDVRVAYAKNQRFPSVDLKSSLDWNGLAGKWSASYTDFRHRPGPDWTGGVVVSIPLTGRTDRARLGEAKLRKGQAVINLKRTENDLIAAFETAVRNIRAATARIQLVQNSVSLTQETLNAEGKRLGSGLTTSYNVSVAQRDSSQALSRQLATYVDLNKSVIELYALVGTLPDYLHVDVKLDGK